MAEQKKANEALNVEEALSQSEAFLIKNKKAIIGAVVAVIIIVAGIVMYKNLYAEPREEKAQAALFKGQEYFEADLYEQALNGDSIGFAGFAKIADEYSGTKAANLAKAYMGICYAHLGQYEAAVKALDSFSGKDQMIAPAMKGAMGNCYAQLGQLDKAASMLLSAADEADNIHSVLSTCNKPEKSSLSKASMTTLSKHIPRLKTNISVLTSQWISISTSNKPNC